MMNYLPPLNMLKYYMYKDIVSLGCDFIEITWKKIMNFYIAIFDSFLLGLLSIF